MKPNFSARIVSLEEVYATSYKLTLLIRESHYIFDAVIAARDYIETIHPTLLKTAVMYEKPGRIPFLFIVHRLLFYPRLELVKWCIPLQIDVIFSSDTRS